MIASNIAKNKQIVRIFRDFYVAMQLVRNVNNLTSFTEDKTSENEWGTLTMHFVVKKILFIINFTSFMNFRIK